MRSAYHRIHLAEVTGEISVRPNPAQHEIKLVWGNLKVSKLMVMDALGRIQIMDNVVGVDEKVLHVYNWAAGVYQLILEGPNGRQGKQFAVIH